MYAVVMTPATSQPPCLPPCLPAGRPLRKDAALNLARILDSGRELFATQGLNVTLDDIAAHAGVGVATVYRRFPNRAALVEALFADAIRELLELADTALAMPDPVAGLLWLVENLSQRYTRDRGLRQLMIGPDDASRSVVLAREQLAPRVSLIVTRAVASGRVRSDLNTNDLFSLMVMLGAVSQETQDLSPELWRRYQALFMIGITTVDGAAAAAVPPAYTERFLGAPEVPLPL